MSYKILPTSKFVKELKRLSKKYPSLKKEIARLAEELHKNHLVGVALGSN
jgi:mRNA-degrading endonuclease RelE of RelBE toxin-antitoxin system